MNDKTQSKLDTKIEAEELKDEALGDEELELVAGGSGYAYGKITWTWNDPKELPKGITGGTAPNGI